MVKDANIDDGLRPIFPLSPQAVARLLNDRGQFSNDWEGKFTEPGELDTSPPRK